jgi:TusA-related sulfurtransferase
MKNIEQVWLPNAMCEAGSLCLGEGLEVLLSRKLDSLSPGDVLEIQSDDAAIEHDLRAWARFTANRWKGIRIENGRFVCSIERGATQRIMSSVAADGERDTQQLVMEAAARIPHTANPQTGFSPRGAAIEKGSPAFPFDVVDAAEAWNPDAQVFYEQATSGQWNPSTDIPWNTMPATIDPEMERCVCQLMTFLAENEFAALYVPAKWIPRIHPHFVETVLFLSTQIRDEARHIEVFVRRALSNGEGLQFSTASTQRSLKTLLDREDYLEASFLLSVLGEGTFLDLLRFIELHAPDPVTAEIARRSRIDEARHVHFALTHMKHAMESDAALKLKLAAAARDRASALAEVRTVNPLVEESLIILAAGGLEAPSLPRGVRAVRSLYDSMHENRIKRLQSIGFSSGESEDLSQTHTPNFM